MGDSQGAQRAALEALQDAEGAGIWTTTARMEALLAEIALRSGETDAFEAHLAVVRSLAPDPGAGEAILRERSALVPYSTLAPTELRREAR